MKKYLSLSQKLSSISIYRNILDDTLIQNFQQLFVCFDEDDDYYERTSHVLDIYSQICRQLFNYTSNGDLSAYLYSLILYDENIFSLECAKNNYQNTFTNIKTAAENDVKTLCELSMLSSGDVIEFISKKYKLSKEILENLPKYSINEQMQQHSFDKIVKFYENNGTGIFAKYKAFILEKNCVLKPVVNYDTITLQDLKLYEMQKNAVIENTLAFMSGHPYHNILLYGDRGCGKSSTIKAVLNEYKNEGLRIIQIAKENLCELSNLTEKLAKNPLKFVIFVDDLTFSENDDNFNNLKAMLEGSLHKQPENVAIYATTNRRHLIKETFTARMGDELHKADTIDEALSLSDRFGLVITYSTPIKDKFLEIVKQLAADRKIQLDEVTLFSGAERFALEKAGRSPRIARQYVDYVESRIALNLPL